eukprot:TRINITY_DN15278_c0_g1_i2.p1 TRINITY_DN15278_c0_g1~~TRINITY_DN15278_c0_g1_i2.p1  ORF type:complete len:1077 (+),score=299.12 TRINITY_DN15278_c0_g1_i2:85-3315(+)
MRALGRKRQLILLVFAAAMSLPVMMWHSIEDEPGLGVTPPAAAAQRTPRPQPPTPAPTPVPRGEPLEWASHDFNPRAPVFPASELHYTAVRTSEDLAKVGSAHGISAGGFPGICDARRAAPANAPKWLQYIGPGRPFPHNSLAGCSKTDHGENEMPSLNVHKAPRAAAAAFKPLAAIDLETANVPWAKPLTVQHLNSKWWTALARAVILGRTLPEDGATIPVWVMPILMDLDDMLSMIERIDVPVRQVVWVVNDPNERKLEAIALAQAIPFGVSIVQLPAGLSGVAASYNMGILEGFRTVSDPPPRWFMVSHADVIPGAGELRQLAYYANHYADDYGLFYPRDNGRFAFGVSRAAVDAVGLFDESIFPSQNEDVDYRWRVRLCGLGEIVTPAVLVHSSSAVRNDRKPSPLADTYRAINERSENSFRYTTAKWWWHDRHHIHYHAPPSGVTRPFNMSAAPLSLWAVDEQYRGCLRAVSSHIPDCAYDVNVVRNVLKLGNKKGAMRPLPSSEARGELRKVWGCGPVLPPVVTSAPVTEAGTMPKLTRAPAYKNPNEVKREDQDVLLPTAVDMAPTVPLFDRPVFNPYRSSVDLSKFGNAHGISIGGNHALCDELKVYRPKEDAPRWLHYVGEGRPFPHNSIEDCSKTINKENETPKQTLRRAPRVSAEQTRARELPYIDVGAFFSNASDPLIGQGLKLAWWRSLARAVILGRQFPEHPTVIPVWVTPIFMDVDEMKEAMVSIDVPVRLLAFTQNSDTEAAREAMALVKALPFGTTVVSFVDQPTQSGFGAGMNTGIIEGLRLVHDPAPTWFYLANADVSYNQGELGQLAYYANQYWEHYGLFYPNEQEHYAFGLSRRAVDSAGVFDESIWPAYNEDVDIRFRIRLCGFGQIVTPGSFKHKHSVNMKKPKKDKRASDYQKIVQRGNNNFPYGNQKWYWYGQQHIFYHAPPSGYKTPWNITGAPLSLWSVSEAHRKCIIHLADGGPEPCLYDTDELLQYLPKCTIIHLKAGPTSLFEQNHLRPKVGCGPVLRPPVGKRDEAQARADEEKQLKKHQGKQAFFDEKARKQRLECEKNAQKGR